jgi:hypothetical protein
MYNNENNNDEPIGGNGLLAGIPLENTVMPPQNNNDNIMQQPINNGPMGFDNNLNNMGMDNQMPNNNLMGNNNMMNGNLMDNNGFGFNNQMPNNITINTNQNNVSPNVEQTVQRIKDSVNTLRNEGQRIEVEDFDFDDFYQIVIRVDKQ